MILPGDSGCEQRPGDFVSADCAAPVDWLVAAAVRLGDCYPKEVVTLGAVSGEIDGHLDNVARTPFYLNWGALVDISPSCE